MKNYFSMKKVEIEWVSKCCGASIFGKGRAFCGECRKICVVIKRTKNAKYEVRQED